ncbi:MAG: hypothetical protein AAB451_00835 [Patescibacteria group bacterium]
MIRVRWFVWALGVTLLTVAYFRGELRELTISFCLGMIGGFFFDIVGVKMMNLWYYSRQPFLSWKYFSIVVSAWGVFGVAINLLWEWIIALMGPSLRVSLSAFIVVTLILLLFHELPNLKARNWKYNTPAWLVIIGWFPMVMLFRLIFIVIR